MKERWLALTATILIGTLYGENDNPCGTGCEPKVKRCVDCECYSPAYYDLQCDWGFFIHGDFLYWYGKESNLAYAVKEETVLRGNETSPNAGATNFDEAFTFDSPWDPGVRIGVGWNTPCDGWDIEINWTYYHTKRKESKSVPDFAFAAPSIGSKGLLNPWNSPVQNANNAVFTNKIDGRWDFVINSFDLEIGRKYWTSPCFTFRPFGGLRGSWTETKFEADSSLRTYTVSTGPNSQSLTQNRFDNDFWGVGLLAGVEPAWYWTRCFAIYAGGDVALLWGEHKMKKRERSFIVSDGIQQADFTFSSGQSRDFFIQPILDLELGLRFEDTYCCDRYRLTLDAGWEHHVWFNHNQRYKSYSVTTQPATLADSSFVSLNYDETQHNTSFGGFVLRARFDF